MTDTERQERRAEQRGGRDNTDLQCRKAKFGQIGRQDDGREPVAESACRARNVQEGDVRWPSYLPSSHFVCHTCFNRHCACSMALAAEPALHVGRQRRYLDLVEARDIVPLAPDPEPSADNLAVVEGG